MSAIGQWLRGQFRGWSFVHYLLEAAIGWIAGVMGTIFAVVSLTQVALLCVGILIAGFCLISLWVRRNEGQREARPADKAEAKGSVKTRLIQVAESLRKAQEPKDALSAAKRAVRYVRGYFHESVAEELLAAANVTDQSEQWKDAMAELADQLEIMADIVYASDIKRLPAPGDR